MTTRGPFKLPAAESRASSTARKAAEDWQADIMSPDHRSSRTGSFEGA
ncbi:hypothetical protein OG895_32665 [Streptomyces sp. NBC_00201]|nr:MULTISPECIES: hypothetical protein [unclassified Streptomyces]MCX5052020.1 hypothetical protein [Streptomyces sp. NBC_00474]MCX5249915.1 hypothetical protein [Streptomyces sp. NBC_00201]